MNTITLHTGVEVPEVIAKTSAMLFQQLWNTNPVAAFELIQLARDPNHQPFGNTADALWLAGFLDTNGHVRADIRSVILASVTGDGVGMELVNPITGQG